MTQTAITALMKAERAVEHVVRTRGRNSNEYFRILREYQALLHKAMQHGEAASIAS
jgi:hypothetical protein